MEEKFLVVKEEGGKYIENLLWKESNRERASPLLSHW